MSTLWTAEDSIETWLSTELNSLADATNSSASAAKSNDASSTERRLYANIEIYSAAQGSARATDAVVSVYLIPEVDDTNYGDTTNYYNYHVGTVKLDAATTARYNIIRNVLLPPSDFKVLLRNDTGQALASSGNTVKAKRFSVEDV